MSGKKAEGIDNRDWEEDGRDRTGERKEISDWKMGGWQVSNKSHVVGTHERHKVSTRIKGT